MSRARALLAVATLAVSLAAPVLTAAPASAAGARGVVGLDTGTDLLAIQPAGSLPGHLVAAGAKDGGAGVVVTDETGADPVPVPQIENATALALGPDGRTVWVSSADGTIYSFSVDDPGEVQVYPTHLRIYYLAVGGNGLVYTSSLTTLWSLRTLDPDTGTVSDPISVGLVNGDHNPALRLSNVEANPDLLAVGITGNGVDLLDVGGATPLEIGAIPDIVSYNVMVAPDAASVLVAQNDPAFASGVGVQRYSVDATPRALGSAFPTERAAYGLAVDPSDHYLAAASFGVFASYGPSNSQLLHTYRPPSGVVTVLRGVAWLGLTLFTMTLDEATGEVLLNPHGDAIQATTTLTATGPATASINEPFTITGHLSDRGTTIGNVRLDVTQTDETGTRSLGTTQVGPLGNYFLHVSAVNGLANTWRVTFAATPTHRAVTATFSLVVARTPTFLSISTNYDSYARKQTAIVSVHLGTTYRSRYVRVYANQAGIGKRQIAAGLVDSSGRFTTGFLMTRNTSFSATFGGDLRHAPAAVSRYVHTRADATMTLLGYYATDSNGLRLYHKSQYVHLFAHVDPYKPNQCAYFDGQYLLSGKWHDLGFSNCFRLGSHSNAQAYYDMPHAGVIGRVYRFGFYYKGDSINAGQGSLWRYLKLTA